LLSTKNIENGFALIDDGAVVAEVRFRERSPAWPDQARAAYLDRLDRRSAAAIDSISGEVMARGLRRLRVQCAARDATLREFYESAGLRFRGMCKGAALFERILSTEEARTPFPAAIYERAGRLPVCVLLDNIRSQYNVGSFFRTADAAGIEKLILCGITGCPPAKTISKTALGAEDRVPWEHSWRPLDVTGDLRERGFEIVAIETSAGSVDLFDWRPRFPVCAVFGNEVDGISPEVLDVCESRIRIPMLGLKHSLNVAVAGGIVIYELLRNHRLFGENSG
jgi:23S rRNA (guanosine2251-2'-O)-methyltransferase